MNILKYVFSKNAIIDSMLILMQRGEAANPSSFDTYSNWNNDFAFGKEAVLNHYDRNGVEKKDVEYVLSDAEKEIIKANITQNVTSIADDYPGTEFYIYYTPYSIYYIDYFKLSGELTRQIQAEEYITSLLLEHKNIHVYSFYMKHELIENPAYYKDLAHHSQDASDMIIKWLYEGEGELTTDNYKDYYSEMNDYYSSFNFDGLF